MSAANKIDLAFHGRYDEAICLSAFKPGHLLQIDSNRKLAKNTKLGIRSPILVAFTDDLRGYQGDPVGGRQLMDAYAANDRVPFGWAVPGDVLNLRLPANAAAVVISDGLICDGAGCVVKASTLPTSVLYALAAASPVGGTLNSHTTITAFTPKYTIPGNSARAGDLFRIRASVLFPNASNSTETSVITLKVGAVTIIATTALDHAAGDIAQISALVHYRAVGASGVILATGTQGSGVPGTATERQFYLAETALDTTADRDITVSQTNSASHANTGGQLVELTVEKLGTSDVALVAVSEEAVDNSAGSAEALINARIL